MQLSEERGKSQSKQTASHKVNVIVPLFSRVDAEKQITDHPQCLPSWSITRFNSPMGGIWNFSFIISINNANKIVTHISKPTAIKSLDYFESNSIPIDLRWPGQGRALPPSVNCSTHKEQTTSSSSCRWLNLWLHSAVPETQLSCDGYLLRTISGHAAGGVEQISKNKRASLFTRDKFMTKRHKLDCNWNVARLYLITRPHQQPIPVSIILAHQGDLAAVAASREYLCIELEGRQAAIKWQKPKSSSSNV